MAGPTQCYNFVKIRDSFFRTTRKWAFIFSFPPYVQEHEVISNKLRGIDRLANSFVVVFFHFQYDFIGHTHVQLTFTKDNLQQNENYNLKLTKKKPSTIKTLVVTKIK